MGRRGRHRRFGFEHSQIRSSESLGRRSFPGFRPWRASESRPSHGDASLDSILFDRWIVPHFWSKHFCRETSLRDRRLDVDLVRLPFRLAIVPKSTDCIFRSGPAPLFGSIFILRETMPVLRAQHAPDRLVVLELLQNEISAGLRAVYSRVGFSFSHTSIRHRASSRARCGKFGLSTVCEPTPMDRVRRAGDRTVNFALARPFFPFLQRICAQYDRGAIDWGVYRTLRAGIY